MSPIKSQVIKAVQFDSLVEERKKFSIKLNILQQEEMRKYSLTSEPKEVAIEEYATQ